MGAERNNPIVYASKARIRELFLQQYGPIEKVESAVVEESEDQLGGRLKALWLELEAAKSGRESQRTVEQLNIDSDEFQAQKIASGMLDSPDIPPVTELWESGRRNSPLYQFACPLSIRQIEIQTGEQTIEVAGRQESVEFRGITSKENWASLSRIHIALESGGKSPFKGILSPVNKADVSTDRVQYDVQFLFISEPDPDAVESQDDFSES